MSWLARLRNLWRPDQLSREIDRELTFHLAERTDELIAQGMEPDAARQEARRRFGNAGVQREATREQDLLGWLETLVADLRYAVRALLAMPVFSTVAILSLALGIGANTAIFSLINVAMLKTLPVSRPDELVRLSLGGASPVGGKAVGFSPALFEQIRERQDVFAGIFSYGSTGLDLSEGGETHPIAVGLVTGDFFSTLGISPILGRLIGNADEGPTCNQVAVVTHAFWRSDLAGTRDVVGRTINLAGHPFQVVGVTPPAFFGVEYGYDAPIWTSRCALRILRGPRAGMGAWIVARLKPGITLEQVQARFKVLAPDLLGAAGEDTATTITVTSFARGMTGLAATYGRALSILMAVVGVVLLIACANIANLLLARATARQHEMAVRLALGASRVRLIRQLLTESLLLALAGAVLGALFAGWGSRLLVTFMAASRQRLDSVDLSPDLRVLAFTITVGVLTGVLFGLAPAWRTVRVHAQAAMKSGGRGVAEGHSRFGVGKALVVAQIALSLVLVAAAGLMLSSWRRLATVDPGFERQGVLLVGVNAAAIPLESEHLATTYQGALERFRGMPGVRRASLSTVTPFGRVNAATGIDVDGYAPTSRFDAFVMVNVVSDGYFATTGTRLLAGRDFGPGDRPGSPPVAIVSEELARKFFGTTDVVGRTVRTQRLEGLSPPIEIVGLAADTKQNSLREPAPATLYHPFRQEGRAERSVTFELGTDGPPAQLIPRVTAALAEIHPRFVLDSRTFASQVEQSIRLPRTLAVLAGFFGLLALFLAAMGLYGILSYTIARRRTEIGVRLALGAAQARIVRMVLGESGIIVVAGVAIGVGLALAGTRLVKASLFGVEPDDPETLVLSALVLGVVALVAAIIPARRAARQDPVAALRED